MGRILDRDAILAAEDVETVDIDCPEWGKGAVVRLRSITGAQRDSYEQSLITQRGSDRQINMRNARAKLVVLCAVDAKGERLFTEADLQAVSGKSAKVLDRLWGAARKLCGLTPQDVEDLTEGFDDAQSDSFTSD